MFKIPYHFLHSLPPPSLGRVGVGSPFALSLLTPSGGRGGVYKTNASPRRFIASMSAQYVNPLLIE